MAKHTRHAKDLTITRKRTKKLRREAQNRIRKARREAMEADDRVALDRLEKIAKEFERALTPINKEKGLSKRLKHNVNREIGKELKLEDLNKKPILNKKKQKRLSTRTFNKIFGKEKAKPMIMELGTREVNKRSNEFWHAMYQAQDMLLSAGFVPIEEIYGPHGSIGSDLLEVGSNLVDNGFWATIHLDYKEDYSTWVVMDEDDIDEQTLPEAIFKYYEQQYDM